MFYLITFENTHTAIQTKKLLTGRMPIRTIPTLREISASCGISIRVEDGYLDALQNFLKTSDLNPKMYELYRIQTDPISDRVTGYESLS